MHNSNCKCSHHRIAMLVGLFTWVSAILFFLAVYSETAVWGLISDEYFQFTIVFALLGFGLNSGMCRCCGQAMKGGMDCACRCGDCVGGKCDSQHSSDHQHM